MTVILFSFRALNYLRGMLHLMIVFSPIGCHMQKFPRPVNNYIISCAKTRLHGSIFMDCEVHFKNNCEYRFGLGLLCVEFVIIYGIISSFNGIFGDV